MNQDVWSRRAPRISSAPLCLRKTERSPLSTEAKTRNLFRSGTVFFIIAGISFLVAAIKETAGGLVVNGVVMLVIGIVIRSKNTK